MQPSFYLKEYKTETPGQLLLFSTCHLSKILINEETFKAIEENSLSPENVKLLAKLGMIVPDREAEKAAVAGFFERYNRMNKGLDFIVALNLECNFACKYCFEGSIKGDLYMSMATADRFIAFVKEKFTDDKKTLLLDFYGGEPLLSLDLIKYISRELRDFTGSKGASFSFSLVTNGALLKRKTALELSELGLKSVKITVDGPAEIHNKNRPFKSGAPSFDIVLQNIKEICDIVKVNIGGNFEIDNYRIFPSLLDFLNQEGLTPDKLGFIKFDPVTKPSERVLTPTDYRGGCMSVNEPWLFDASTYLREEIFKRRYSTVGIRHKLCMVESKNSFVVNYDGTLYKCPGFIGMEEFAVGNLNDDISECSEQYNPGLWKNDDCMNCSYLPLCYGGCRYMTFLRDGDVKAIDCQKEYFDSSLESMIKQEVEYGIRVSG